MEEMQFIRCVAPKEATQLIKELINIRLTVGRLDRKKYMKECSDPIQSSAHAA